jgi:choline dehydrogenase-like flavoprotein
MSALVRGERPALTFWEQVLRCAAALLALVSIGFALAYFLKGLLSHSEFPFVTNSIAKDTLLAGLALLVLWDPRRWAVVAVPLIVAAHLLMPAVMVILTIAGKATAIDHTWIGPPKSVAQFRGTWIAADVLMATVFVGSSWMAARSRYDMRYLTPSAFRALMALAEILVLREDREITPPEVAGRVDHYLASFRAREKWKVWGALFILAWWPLLTLRPPFHMMSPEAREGWLRRRFEDVVDRRLPRMLQAVIRTAQQFCFMGYYGHERAAERAGYLPFSRRPGAKEALDALPPQRHGVACMNPSEIAGEELNADVVIAGTGAGGAMLAYELARRGREVLMLERGAHVEPRDFTENEATQLSNLYADGALTLAKDFQFQVAQGMCVGGSTVVNNAVCFDLPQRVLDRWLDPEGLDAGLDPDRLRSAFEHVRRFLRVDRVGPSAKLNPGALRILAGLGEHSPWPFRLVECNIVDCLGSGYCNIGCAYGKKLSALDWTLPRAQREFRGAVRILPDCRVEQVTMEGPWAKGVRARLGDGRRLGVRANIVVLSAGAMASSLILQRSGLAEGRAGRGVAFNVASPVTLDFFPEELHSERGMQITHYLEPTGSDHDGLALETWFNPIVSQSLFMPGWFEQHWENMRHYRNMTCLGVVLGSESNGRVTASWPGREINLDFTPSNADFVRLKEGIKLAARIGLEAGARRVLPATFEQIEIRRQSDISSIDSKLGNDRDVSVNSAHPQGGNPISANPVKGVVDPSFRVYGTLNLHVCDASVFPSSITVNPQLTVMALAAYAADEIAGPPPSTAQPLALTSQAPAPGPGS